MTEKTFISYPHAEQPFAQDLRDRLRRWRHATWLDVDDIPAGITPGSGWGWNDAIHHGWEYDVLDDDEEILRRRLGLNLARVGQSDSHTKSQ
jgi:hypothetical protein